MLEATAIGAGYGRKQIVHGVDLTVGQGEILLVLGHNGAGKTTLMRSLFGLLPPTAGRIRYEGRDIAGRSPAQNVADGIAFIPQGHGIFRTLSVRDNLDLGAFVEPDKSLLPERLESIYRMFPILKERASQIGGTLSGGQQQMLAIGMALMHAPRLVILDEPSIGLAPNLVDKVMEAIAFINRTMGTTILMVEQNVKYSLPIASRVAVLKTGRKIYDGPPDPLHDRVELMKLF
ncbi:amino acid/amide ABC transporter ATP-binding protein 2 (HAAT family) [Stella humosa]|uniref:Amino acid/amide ABC transporter ATP-binding protein 2 (HAAT family) n=2 Tax=Stella humosa TaxID=94 RepID=A0A3N1MLG8_9PROT|nr:amino acid/amide ABC transporter ATP-binding protein 2 (HAAT family) [Stella humosa]